MPALQSYFGIIYLRTLLLFRIPPLFRILFLSRIPIPLRIPFLSRIPLRTLFLSPPLSRLRQTLQLPAFRFRFHFRRLLHFACCFPHPNSRTRQRCRMSLPIFPSLQSTCLHFRTLPCTLLPYPRKAQRRTRSYWTSVWRLTISLPISSFRLI